MGRSSGGSARPQPGVAHRALDDVSRTATRQSGFPDPTVSTFRKYMALPCVAKLSA